LRSRRGGLLIALLVLPLYIPTMIFGIGAISALLLGPDGGSASLLILAAISLGAMVIGPIAAAAALRAQLG
jgi:heme exporter protein B